MTDCLLIGHNEGQFPDYVSLLRAMGTDSGAWRDLNLAFVEIDGRPRHAMDVLNLYNDAAQSRGRLSNLDFLWPAITYLTSYLTRRGFTVDYINLFQDERRQLQLKLERDQILAIAITTTLYVALWPLEEVIRFVRRYNPHAVVIVGGPFIHNQSQTMAPAQLMKLFEHLGADIYVISPEGELTLANVLGAIKSQRPLHFIANIAFRDNGRFTCTQVSPESNSLADSPVDYGLFPTEQFGEFVTVRTAKSCPFACSFCGFPQRAGKYTYESVDVVERELDQIRRIGTVTTLTFIDDTFNVPMARFKEIMRMMIRNRYGFRWNSFLRADHVDDECIALMADSGCDGVFLGLESGSETMLKVMNKTSRPEHYRRVIPSLKEVGIVTHCNLIIGFPGETEDTVRQTIKLIEEAQPDFFRAQLWYCDPTTPIWGKREQLGIKGSAFSWSHPTMTAAIASQLVESMFLDVKHADWLPQQGFELWSVFYLQRKGMRIDDVKTFVRRFNDAIKVKVRNPDSADLEPATLEALATSSRFVRSTHTPT